MLSQIEIEKIENKYLNKFYHFLKFAEDEMMYGFQTKEKIKDDWIWKYWWANWWISDFSTWAERIVYALLNGKWIWQPNSCPVGSDLFFEVNDAYIHIDLKTVQTGNINDYRESIFVWENQNSYKWKMKVTRGKNKWERNYVPALPTYYNRWKPNEKICLTYFVTILYEPENLNIININIICMPNWELWSHYGSKVLRPWKLEHETRFSLIDTQKFELLPDTPNRIKVVFFDKNMNSENRKKLKFFESIYDSQKDNEC